MTEDQFTHGFPRSRGVPNWPGLKAADFSPVDQTEFDRLGTNGRLHEVFDSIALKYPDRLAIVGSESLTYLQLRQRSAQAAVGLASLGVKPGDIVCIIARNDWRNIAAMLGALRVGATCNLVASDAISQLANPPIASLSLARATQVFYFLEDHEKSSAMSLTSLHARSRTSELASLFHGKSNQSHTLSQVASYDFPAFVFFTSGSTGTPQAVSMSHQFILLDIARQINDLAIRPVDRFDLLFSPNFSAFLAPTFGAILTGASLWICSLDQSIPTDLIDWLIDSEITISTMSVSVMRALFEQLPKGGHWPSLRILSVGAEPLRAKDVLLFHDKTYDQAILQNAMATTETRTYAQYFFDRNQTPEDPIPIGYPVLNRDVEILDDRQGPLSVGQVGHVRITSKLLAAGNHLGGITRLDSSDLGYFDEKGLLYCVGRKDSMVKIRGQKVYLNQIETEILRVKNVSNAFVFTFEATPNNASMIACIESADPTVQDAVFDHLRKQLPPIAFPSRLSLFEQFPRTSTGKIDRQGLIQSVTQNLKERSSIFSDSKLADHYTAPRNETEKQLVPIWQEVLGFERIGIHDNFFALGGHSLLAVRLTSRVSDVFNVQLGVRQVFEIPSIAEQALEIEAMRSGDHKEGNIRLRRRFHEVGHSAPLSHAQERLWFLEQLEGSLTAYNLPMFWRIHGTLDPEALRKALEAIVLRHDPLRTTFKHDGTMPVQIVQQLDRFELPVMDLRDLDPSAKKLKVEQALLSEANGAFDLKCDLMIRARLLRLEDHEHELLLTMHHIASDGWSIDVLSRELSRLYSHFQDVSDGPTDDLTDLLEPLSVNYIDYTLWQRENLSEHRIEGLLKYWREELKDLPALELPTDRPRPNQASYHGSTVEVKLPKDLISKLEALCSSEQVTLQMLLLAAFETLLYRYSHQEDFAVGIPFAGREDSQLEELIGFFVSTLVIRADLSGEPTFQELLSRVRQKSLAAYDHQALPLQILLADLQPERHLSRPPLFQVMFQLLSRNEAGLKLQGLEVTDADHGSNRVKFDLELHLSRQSGDISGAFYYSTDLFDSETIQRMALHYLRLLESIAANPNQKVSQLEILTDQERSELLVGFNDTATDYPRDLCVHEIFEQQVERTPDSIAVVLKDQQLTYRELNERANRLARYLRSKGVGTQTPVGMCLERSLDLVVSILGILKAGASYVPLDAEYPTKRLEYMLKNARIEHLVTHLELLEKLPKTDRIDILTDTDTNEISCEDAKNLGLELDSKNLAYVIFTSGSTGEPKGVMIEHRSIARLVFQDCYASFGSDRVLLQLAPISFDASTFELWGALLHGAKLVMPNPGLHDGRMIKALIRRHGVTTLWLTSSLFNQIVEDDPRNLLGLDELLIGGEALSPMHVKSAIDSLGDDLTIVNGYGPTESTTFACCYRIPSSLKSSKSSISIGRPISNTQAYILDASQQLVPLGIPGELYIGGDGLARGYLNRPDFTAERFVPNPFSQDLNSRLYRTGDLCRWRVDGNIEYLGRIDHQVKLRGFRIELGEIESTLASHPAIAQCMVILREDRPGDKRLVAYYTASGEILPSIAQLREHLQASLPEYMIPSAFVHLDALPLTPSGKIDRRGLPVPDLKDLDAQEHYTPPRNGIEEQLVEIWQEILGLERIGIHDNFFALGGHSLLAVRLFNTINQRFQKTLPLSLIFQRGSIAQIALSLVQATDDSAIARVVRLSTGSLGPKLIVMPGLTGQVLYALKVVERLESRFDIYGLEPNLSSNHLETFGDFCSLASEYIEIILKDQPIGPYNFVGYSYGGILGYEIARQLQQRGHRIDFVGVIDTGPNSQSPSKDLQSVANHWMRVGSNLPGWIGANCGPEKLKETLKKGSRRFRYWARCFLIQGKTEYRFEDEFGARRSHDDRHEILSRIFQGFNAYRPEPYGDRVTLFRASVRPLLHSLSPDLGWSSVAREVLVHRIPGDHNTILEPAGLNRISDLIIQSQNHL